MLGNWRKFGRLICERSAKAAERIDRRAGLGEDEGETMTILITLGLVCLVIGVVLRAFSKSPSDLSLNQRAK
jgi:hypothetical protein